MRPSLLLVPLATLVLTFASHPVEAAKKRPPRRRLAPTAMQTAMPTATAVRPPRTMVALVFGQSNAANYGETRHTADPRVSVMFEGQLAPAADPLPGADGEGGSVWTRLGDDLLANDLYDRVIFVPAAVGGTEIAEWTPDVEKHFKLVEKAIEGTHRAGLQFTHLLWEQGESDAYLHIDPTSYRVRFMSILKRIRELGVDAPIYVAVSTRCGPYPQNADIRWVQRDLVNHDLRIWQGPDTDTLGPEFRHDGCHFSARGLEETARLWVHFLSDGTGQ